MTTSSTADRELFVTRVVNAPCELVFDVWTKPEHVVHWWGPDGFTNTIHEMEVKPGGVWKLTMHGPDGTDFPNEIKFIEVIRPTKLVWTHGTNDPNDPGQFVSTVTFTEIGKKKTEITMRMVFKTKEAFQRVVEKFGAIEGNHQHLNRLEKYLEMIQNT